VAGAKFITLTYPDEARPAPQVAKKHLEAFFKRARRRWPRCAFLWKQEYGGRTGKLHYHLVAFGLPGAVDGSRDKEALKALRGLRAWVAASWYQVVGSGLHKHLKAGTQTICTYGSYRGVAGYVSKYLGKVQPAQADAPGRWWGISGAIEAYTAPVEVVELTRSQAARLIRTLTKVMEGRARRSKFYKRRRVPSYIARQETWTFRKTNWQIEGTAVLDRLIPFCQGVAIVPPLSPPPSRSIASSPSG
jgi:hypothetical protein